MLRLSLSPLCFLILELSSLSLWDFIFLALDGDMCINDFSSWSFCCLMFKNNKLSAICSMSFSFKEFFWCFEPALPEDLWMIVSLDGLLGLEIDLCLDLDFFLVISYSLAASSCFEDFVRMWSQSLLSFANMPTASFDLKPSMACEFALSSRFLARWLVLRFWDFRCYGASRSSLLPRLFAFVILPLRCWSLLLTSSDSKFHGEFVKVYEKSSHFKSWFAWSTEGKF